VSPHDDYCPRPGLVERWIDAYAQAWRDKSADAVAELFTADDGCMVRYAERTGYPDGGGTANRFFDAAAT
jgi:hypothetical protein